MKSTFKPFLTRNWYFWAYTCIHCEKLTEVFKVLAVTASRSFVIINQGKTSSSIKACLGLLWQRSGLVHHNKGSASFIWRAQQKQGVFLHVISRKRRVTQRNKNYRAMFLRQNKAHMLKISYFFNNFKMTKKLHSKFILNLILLTIFKQEG